MVATIGELDIRRHDRYLVYHMLGRHVSVSHVPSRSRRKPFEGIVEEVVRDIFERQVVLVMNGKTVRFDEPGFVLPHGGNILFVYGDMVPEPTDDEVFDRMRSGEDYGITIDDALEMTSPQDTHVVRFEVGSRVLRRCRTWRKSA